LIAHSSIRLSIHLANLLLVGGARLGALASNTGLLGISSTSGNLGSTLITLALARNLGGSLFLFLISCKV